MRIFPGGGRPGIGDGDALARGEDLVVLHKSGCAKGTGQRLSLPRRAMLENPAYKGSAGFGKTRLGPRKPALRPQRGDEPSQRHYSIYPVPEEEQERIPVPAIVSEDLFAAVQDRLVENKKHNRQRKRGARYLLQGLLQCQCCRYAYYGKPVSRSAAKGKIRKYAYYRCVGTDAYRFGGERMCWNKQVRTDLLEAAVWEDVCALLREPDRVRQEYERRLNEEPKGQGAEAAQLSTIIQMDDAARDHSRPGETN